MMVRVVEMRRKGEKLSPEELLQAEGQVGDFTLTGDYATLHARPNPSGSIYVGHLIRPLYDARITRVRGDSFVVAGRYLPSTQYMEGDRVGPVYPQSWWCRIEPALSP